MTEPDEAYDACFVDPDHGHKLVLPDPREIVLTPQEAARGDLLLARVIDFTRFLWELGIEVGPGRVVELTEALPLIDVSRRDEFYTFLKVFLVSKHEHDVLFDMAFAYFWQQQNANGSQSLQEVLNEQPNSRKRSLALPKHRQPQEQPHGRHLKLNSGQPQRHPASRLNDARRQQKRDEDDEDDLSGTFSAEEILRRKDFENFSWDELQAAKELMERSRWKLGERQTRRLRAARRGHQLDLRRTLRQSLRTGGEATTLARRTIRRKPRPLVIICDISGSMSLYSRLLLHFVHTVSNGLDNVETFVFGTRLTRITKQLARKDVDEAISNVTKSVQDWSGGTRIGDSLHTFNTLWARRVLGRGAVVLIISDGWDRGDVSLLGPEMSRLQRNCHRLIWLNPLLGQDDYRPVTAGMRASLPYIDDFLPAHNLDSLFALGIALEEIDDRRRAPRALSHTGSGGAPMAQKPSTVGGRR